MQVKNLVAMLPKVEASMKQYEQYEKYVSKHFLVLKFIETKISARNRQYRLKKLDLRVVKEKPSWPMDNLRFRLNFNLSKNNEIYHNS